MVPLAEAIELAGGVLVRDESTLPEPPIVPEWPVLGVSWSREGTRARGSDLELVSEEGVASLRQRLGPVPGGTYALGAWIESDSPGISRVQLSTLDGVAASELHPGDGRRRFLSTTLDLVQAAPWLDVWLQILEAGRARFDGVLVCRA